MLYINSILIILKIIGKIKSPDGYCMDMYGMYEYYITQSV